MAGKVAYIGDFYQGGYIFYLNGNGGGLIAAPTDQPYAIWGCEGTNIPGANGTYIGTGYQNTMDIITADGGFDFSKNFDYQEEICFRLLLSEIYGALCIQKEDGFTKGK